MKLLNDKMIRNGLIHRLEKQFMKPRAIIEELRVHNGNAIADVVALYKEAHCYEIKSDLDKIVRIHKQGEFYNLSFRKITLVTTKKHLPKALELSPNFWGVMVAEERNGKVILKSVRSASTNSKFCKNLALMTLWKKELLALVGNEQKSYKTNREWLADRISKTKGKKEVSSSISTALFNRYEELLS